MKCKLPVEKLFEVYDVDFESGTLRRKKNGRTDWSVSKSGYKQTHCLGTNMLVHRIIWAMYHGRWPEATIDHINGNRLDCRIGNLREASQSQNSFNTKMRSTNKSGFKGVCFLAKLKKWGAFIHLNYRTIWLGAHDTAEQAHEAYCAKLRELAGEFGRTA
jgi:HNH endonuclease/AP2 domain